MIILGVRQEALDYARRRGMESAQKSSPDDLREDAHEACKSWGYNPADVFGLAWLSGWNDAKNQILYGNEWEDA